MQPYCICGDVARHPVGHWMGWIPWRWPCYRAEPGKCDRSKEGADACIEAAMVKSSRSLHTRLPLIVYGGLDRGEKDPFLVPWLSMSIEILKLP